jgi:hypothetical protein
MTPQEHIQTQATNVLAYLKAGNTITSLEALNLFNSLRLAAVIFILRKTHTIKTERVMTDTGKNIARYSLVVGG